MPDIQLKTTVTPGNRIPGSLAGTPRFDSKLQDPDTSPSTHLLHHGGGGGGCGRSAQRARPPSPDQELGGCKGRWHETEGGESQPR